MSRMMIRPQFPLSMIRPALSAILPFIPGFVSWKVMVTSGMTARFPPSPVGTSTLTTCFPESLISWTQNLNGSRSSPVIPTPSMESTMRSVSWIALEIDSFQSSPPVHSSGITWLNRMSSGSSLKFLCDISDFIFLPRINIMTRA